MRSGEADIVSGQKDAHEQLRKSELFYRNLIADSLDGILLTDENGVISFSSASIRNILGYEPEMVMHRNAFDFVHPEDMSVARSAFNDELRQEPHSRFINIRLKHNNGDWVWCIVRGHNLFQNPFVAKMAIYFYDDSLRRFAEEALETSEKRFRNLVHNLNLGVMVLNAQGEVIVFNKAAELMLGVNETEFRELHATDTGWNIIHEDGTAFARDERPTSICFRTKAPVRDMIMGIFRPSRPEVIWVLINTDPVFDEKGNIANLVSSFTDITEQRKAAQEQIDHEIQRQRLLTQATIDGQEKERLHLGKELHDNISQHLTMTRLYLEVVREKADGEVQEMITRAHINLSEIINKIRVLSQSLVPPTLGDLGLLESVQDVCDALRMTEAFQVEFQHRHFNENELPDNMKLMLFRIIQEQINNIVRHAYAKRVVVKLQADAEHIFLSISDDGVGFDAEKHKKGLGLTGISNRASLFNAKTHIDTAPGKGCSLSVIVPFSKHTDEIHHGD
jgi:PAS domain S-box-containing protein